MTIQDIINDIDAEKNKAIQELEAALGKALTKLSEEHEKRKENLKENYKVRVEEKGKSIEKKTEAHKNMERKTMILRAKREALNIAFEEAIAKLASSKDYVDVLAKLLKNIDLSKATVIAAKGKTSETTDALKKTKKDYKVVSEGTFTGGCIIITDDVEIDLSFETLVSSLRGKLETDVAYKLFN
ncbi:hypothetical protein HOG48_06530 [Candidatus Peregrinibacteria bacterium]|jgi:vacuolar-type H+-ATPase subunit E/Vma4|nr:hypothetical protein [Candidatus Peregrinibacteria bacterium]